MLKKTLFLTVIFMFSISIFYAQGRGEGARTPEERTKQLTEQLKLNKDQVKKVQAIFQKQQDEMKKTSKNGEGFGDPGSRDKMREQREESNKKIMNILNDKQKAEYKKILEEQRKRMEERRQNRN
ncbi:MAG: hypothetical protein KKB34_19650 [Bacteroidetes bacterium]|nr:hypothetical protein [Bacteroidota bacterium]